MAGRRGKVAIKEKVINRKRMYEGKEVKPVMYVNNKAKKMMTGAVDGEIVCGRNGKPLPLRSIGAVI